jgi:hypothetical protein
LSTPVSRYVSILTTFMEGREYIKIIVLEQNSDLFTCNFLVRLSIITYVCGQLCYINSVVARN